MRDYDNMPKLEWQDDKATLARIKAQILREEPLILLMPKDFDAGTIDPGVCEMEEGCLVDCEPRSTLATLAAANSMPALDEIADAAEEARQRVDVDAVACRLIIHD